MRSSFFSGLFSGACLPPASNSRARFAQAVYFPNGDNLRYPAICRALAQLLAFAVVAWGLTAGLARAQALPAARLSSIFPAGGQSGTTFDVTVTGTDLDDAKALHFSGPGMAAVVKMGEPGLGQTGPQPLAGQFTVTLQPEVKPGLYEVRVAGKYGISNPRVFMVGSQPESREVEPNNQRDKANSAALGTTINGRADNAADVDYFKFAAQAGQRVIIDCQAQRIDSRMDATLELYDAAGTRLEINRDTNRRDPLIDFRVPRDGEFSVCVHDFLYAGSPEHFYRLSIGVGPYLDFVFPPAGLAGSQGTYTLYGRNLPGGVPAAGVEVGGKPLESLPVTIALPADRGADISWGSAVESDEAGMDAVEYRLDSPTGLSNPLLVGIAGAPVLVEQEPNNTPAQAPVVTPPCEVVGQFYPRSDQDWVAFTAKQGDVLWIEVFSQRLGLTTDPIVLVQQVKRDDKGTETVVDLQSTDDVASNPAGSLFETASDDPEYRFVAPADGTYRVLVRDLYNASRADPRHVYRLSIRPAQPDFRLVAVPRFPPNNPDPNQTPSTVWTPLLRRGGAEMIEVVAFRREGFDGEIHVTAENLPAGVTAQPMTLGPAQNAGVLVLTAADDAPESIALVTITGRAQGAAGELVRTARPASMVWGGVQNQTLARSRLARSLAVAVTAGETASLTLTAPNQQFEMSRMGTVKVPISLVRRGEFKGNVQLQAVAVPQNVQPQNNKNVDAAQPAGEFELKLPNNAPLGTYSFAIVGIADIPYARNPEALQAAVARKAAVEQLLAEATATAKTAAEGKNLAEQKATESVAAAQKAAEALKAAEQAVKDAGTAAAAATTKAAEAKAAAEKDPANADLAAAGQAAEKAAADAAALLKTATDAQAAAAAASTAAAEQAKAAGDAKTAAIAAMGQADARVKQVNDFLQAFNTQLNDLQNKSKQNNVKLGVPSNVITVKITAAPITLAAIAQPSGPLRQGAALEIPVTVARLYDYADPVLVKLALPNGVGGIEAPQITIAPGQTQGQLAIKANPNATPGTHRTTVQAIAKFNGQDLVVSQDLTLTIEKVEPAK